MTPPGGKVGGDPPEYGVVPTVIHVVAVAQPTATKWLGLIARPFAALTVTAALSLLVTPLLAIEVNE
jgi:hypothetical protein